MASLRSTPLSTVVRCLSPFLLALAVACGSGGGSGEGMVGLVGAELEKPDGSGTFFNDLNEGGKAGSLRIVDVSWGRLVDVHDILATTADGDALETDPIPTFRDIVINETIQSDGQDYRLETNPVSQKTRLVILREKVDDETDEFAPLFSLAVADLAPVQAMSDLPGTPGPFSFVARNAALVVRFNDLLLDDEASELKISENVRILTDYPPDLPYQNKRLIFDANHGGIGEGTYHSTRVIVDLTVSEAEATSMLVPTGINSLGLPPSLTTTEQPNVSIRIPTKTDFDGGQFTILTNLAGHGVGTGDAGPVDFGSDTIDVVRAMRSGNAIDKNNGFLLDINPPELVSGWPISISSPMDNPAGQVGFDFLVDVTFLSPCQAQPEPGNIIELPGAFAEISTLGLPPGFSGVVPGVEIRSLSQEPLAPSELLGSGLFKRTFDAALLPASMDGCWVSFAPLPGVLPAADIDPNSQVVLRFTEPMDPATLQPFDQFTVQRVELDPSPLDIVVGRVNPSTDLKEFAYTPLLPFNHTAGSEEPYFITLLREGGITDLAGNAPADLPAEIEFTLDALSASQRNGGIVMGFNSLDEITHPAGIAPPGAPDIRGQFLFDIERATIKPRPVIRSSPVADRSQAVPGIMIPFTPGVQTPLSPLGSKLMTLWRYCDFGFSSQDESNYNIDVEGLNWSPINAQVVSDIYPEFEMRLAHSHYLPDEHLDMTTLLPTTPGSGLTPVSFAANIHADPLSPQKIVHAKGMGYVLNPVDLFLSATGTVMMPFPLNRGTDPDNDVYYTWRDTSVLTKGGPNGNGIDLLVMEDVGLIPTGTAGGIAGSAQVPSMGLPLLMEFRTYPTEVGVGLNAFDISLAINSSRLPAFRIFSTGGLNSSGQVVAKDPDLEDQPDGGFNPVSSPPFQPTNPDDPGFYIGQLDVISRISRVHTIWVDTEQSGNVTDFLDPLLEPTPDEQPGGTEIIFSYRGATGITGKSFTAGQGYAFDADHIDPYGDVRDFDTAAGAPEFLGSLNGDITFFPVGDTTWQDDIHAVDTSRFFQIRMTFVGNTTTLLNPELSAVGVAWMID